jgi:hypothetical protein
MNRVIEIHDSQLDRITMEGETALIHFRSVYIHQSEGELWVDNTTGWSQEAELRIGNAHVEGSFTVPQKVWGGDINLQDGSLRIGDALSDNLIPIPLQVTGDIELKLESCGETVRVCGTAAHLQLIGAARYVEKYRE